MPDIFAVKVVLEAAAGSVSDNWLLRVDEDEEDDVGVGNASRSISSLPEETWNVTRLFGGDGTPGERSFNFKQIKKIVTS